MAQVFVPDTHALLWYLSAPKRLGDQALQAFRDELAGKATFYVPAIVIVELIWVIKAGRIPATIENVLATIREHYLITSFTADDALQLVTLRGGLAIHDAMIVWEARKREAAVITRDRVIRESGLVETVW